MDGDLVARVLDPADEILPRLHAALGLRQMQVLRARCDRGPSAASTSGHFVNRLDVLGGDDRLLVDVAEERDLALDVGIEKPIGAAEQDVGLNADRAQIADAVLRRLGLQLAGGADERHQRQVHVERVVAADVLPELPDGFEKRQALDVAHRAADFDEHDVDVFRRGADGVLDLVGDVRNHLDGAAQVVAAALLLDDALVDLAGRPVRVA